MFERLAVPGRLAAVVLLAACGPDAASGAPKGEAEPITNRIEVPPEVVANLGITFETATRGRLGVWLTVPGQLEVPERSRWTIRAPAAGRVLSVASRWRVVEAGDEIAELESPELLRAQGELYAAENSIERAGQEAAAARERLTEGEVRLLQSRELEAATKERLEDLKAMSSGGNALSTKELVEALRGFTDAARIALEAAILRDDLRARSAAKDLQVRQARRVFDASLSALSVLTGRSAAELDRPEPGPGAWQALDHLRIRAPAGGAVVELLSARGERVQQGAPLLLLMDTAELRFAGRLPEGDLGLLAAGNPVRIELPSKHLEPIRTELEGPMPMADERTRTIRVEARVPNPGGALPHGVSATAHVRVRQAEREEVLVPTPCVVFDGVEAIVFLRDANDPGVVIRTPVEVGMRGAGLVEVLAGVLDGDEVVADGVHQLKQTGQGKAPPGVHFHADGTYHAEHK